MLDLIQRQLELQKFGFQRIDGRSSLQQRSRAITQFTKDPNCTVMLASIGSAGEGYVSFVDRSVYVVLRLIGNHYRVNLAAASRVHLIEPQWNPMVEAQAVDRVHRIGQAREVLTTRYVTRSSIEEVSGLDVTSTVE